MKISRKQLRQFIIEETRRLNADSRPVLSEAAADTKRQMDILATLKEILATLKYGITTYPSS